MISRSEHFLGWLGAWFDNTGEPQPYIDGCERVPKWLAEKNEGFLAFTDELAVHIRESSYPSRRNETQWSTDEWLRSIYYDIFGPADAPGDPYPVPPDRWGRVRFTSYMLHGVDDEPEWSSPGATAWLTQRGLTHEGVHGAYSLPRQPMQNVRPQPSDYIDHLERLTTAGLREPQPGEPSHQAS